MSVIKGKIRFMVRTWHWFWLILHRKPGFLTQFCWSKWNKGHKTQRGVRNAAFPTGCLQTFMGMSGRGTGGSFVLPNFISPSEKLISSSPTHEITDSQQLGEFCGGKTTQGKCFTRGCLDGHTSFPGACVTGRQLVSFFEKQLVQSRLLHRFSIQITCHPSSFFGN